MLCIQADAALDAEAAEDTCDGGNNNNSSSHIIEDAPVSVDVPMVDIEDHIVSDTLPVAEVRYLNGKYWV